MNVREHPSHSNDLAGSCESAVGAKGLNDAKRIRQCHPLGTSTVRVYAQILAS